MDSPEFRVGIVSIGPHPDKDATSQFHDYFSSRNERAPGTCEACEVKNEGGGEDNVLVPPFIKVI